MEACSTSSRISELASVSQRKGMCSKKASRADHAGLINYGKHLGFYSAYDGTLLGVLSLDLHKWICLLENHSGYVKTAAE